MRYVLLMVSLLTLLSGQPAAASSRRDHEAARAALAASASGGLLSLSPQALAQFRVEISGIGATQVPIVVGAFRDERGGWVPGQRPEQLRSGVEDNLRSLGVDRLGDLGIDIGISGVPESFLIDATGQIVKTKRNYFEEKDVAEFVAAAKAAG